MKQQIGNITFEVTYDPCNYFCKHIKNGLLNYRIESAVGILPYWAIDTMYQDVPVKEAFEALYSFPLHEMVGGFTNKETGESSYPGDPIMYPLMKLVRINSHIGFEETIYFYEHAIVGIKQANGEFYMTRMD